MHYMALTSRHHDGYCLFDSALSSGGWIPEPQGYEFLAQTITDYLLEQ